MEPAAHRRPVARDRLWPHVVWEIVLAAGVVAAVFAVRHEDPRALSGAGLGDLLVLVAAGILLGSAFALSLRAAVPNLAVGAVAVVAGVLTAWLQARARLRAADRRAGHARRGGRARAGDGVVVVGFRLPGWAVGLGAALGLSAAVLSLSAGRTLTARRRAGPAPTGPGRWPIGAAALSVARRRARAAAAGPADPGAIPPGRRPAAGPGQPGGADRRGRAGRLDLLAAGAGLILAMRVRTAVPDDGFTLLGTAAAAAFLGGTSAYGRRGGVFGTVLAAGFLQLAALWLGLVEAEPWTRPALLGGAIVLGLLVGRVVEAAGSSRAAAAGRGRTSDAGPETQLWDPYGTGSFARPGTDPYPTGGFTPAASYREGAEPYWPGQAPAPEERAGHRPSRPVTSVPTGSRAATSVSSGSRAEAPTGDRPGRPGTARPVLGRDDVQAAADRLGDRVRRTPSVVLDSRPFGTPVALKLELLQHTGSFKARGMLNRLLAADLPAGSRVVAASGGNAGLAVAYAARELGLTAHIVVPVTAPPVKVARLRALGAAVVQEGAVYAEAFAVAEGYATRAGLPLVHAYDQPEVCAGNGTLGLELVEQVGPVDTVLVATGGGGLIAGIAAALAGRARVIAVEPERCPTLHAALAAGAPVDVDVGGIAADSLGAEPDRVGLLGGRARRPG